MDNNSASDRKEQREKIAQRIAEIKSALRSKEAAMESVGFILPSSIGGRFYTESAQQNVDAATLREEQHRKAQELEEDLDGVKRLKPEEPSPNPKPSDGRSLDPRQKQQEKD